MLRTYICYFLRHVERALCAVDGSGWDAVTHSRTQKETSLTLLEKYYLHFFLLSVDNDADTVPVFSGWLVATTGLAHENTERINFFPLTPHTLMNNLMNQNFRRLAFEGNAGSGKLLRFHEISACPRLSSSRRRKTFPSCFMFFFCFPNHFHKMSHTRELEKYCTEE